MPGRVSIGGNRYRFGYQGQFAEYDPETGYNHFEARLLDTRIGRWLTTDPAGQFFSPYVSMGNNPVNGVDPDGRLFGKLRAQIYTLFNGGSYEKLNGNWVARNSEGLVAKNFGGSWFKGTNEWDTSIEWGELEYAGVEERNYKANAYYVIEQGGLTHSGAYYPEADIFVELYNPHDSRLAAVFKTSGKEMGRVFKGSGGVKAYETEKFRTSGRRGEVRSNLLFIPVHLKDVEASMNYHLKYDGNSQYRYFLLTNNCKRWTMEGFIKGGNWDVFWDNNWANPVPAHFKGKVEFQYEP